MALDERPKWFDVGLCHDVREHHAVGLSHGDRLVVGKQTDARSRDRVLNVNLRAAFLCSLRAAQVMARRPSGVIINMSSGGATRAHRGNVAYDASKGGIEAMTRAMALDLAPYGIRANAVVPGLICMYDIDDGTAAERGQVVPMGGSDRRKISRARPSSSPATTRDT